MTIYRYEQSNEIPKKWAKKQLEIIRGFEVPETEPTRWDGRIDASTDTFDPFADNEAPQQAQQTNTQVPNNNTEDLAYFKKVSDPFRITHYAGNETVTALTSWSRSYVPTRPITTSPESSSAAPPSPSSPFPANT